MSETFTFNVNYATTFEDLERLRARMLAFVEAERRDYQPIFDVKVNGMRPLRHTGPLALICARVASRLPRAGEDDTLCRHQVQEQLPAGRAQG